MGRGGRTKKGLRSSDPTVTKSPDGLRQRRPREASRSLRSLLIVNVHLLFVHPPMHALV